MLTSCFRFANCLQTFALLLYECTQIQFTIQVYTKIVYYASVHKTSLLYKYTQNQFTVQVYINPVYCICVHKLGIYRRQIITQGLEVTGMEHYRDGTLHLILSGNYRDGTLQHIWKLQGRKIIPFLIWKLHIWHIFTTGCFTQMDGDRRTNGRIQIWEGH